MTAKDLIPLGIPGNEEHDKAVRAKLKGSSSDKRKIAQRLAGIKKAKSENVEKKILSLISDPKVSALEIMIMIEEVKNNELLQAPVKIQLINTAIKAHTALFGTKNLNVNIDLPTSAKSINEIWLEVQDDAQRTERKRNSETSTNGEEL